MLALALSVEAGAEPARLHRYTVSIDEPLTTISVRACFDGQPPSYLVSESLDAAAALVEVSVDGTRDTPARLKSYLAPLSADFIGLTGDPKATAEIAARFAAVFFKEPAAKDGSYNVMHTTQVFAVDKAGRLRASFSDASIEDMATITKLLLAEPG